MDLPLQINGIGSTHYRGWVLDVHEPWALEDAGRPLRFLAFPMGDGT
jgi:hypothetical protein